MSASEKILDGIGISIRKIGEDGVEVVKPVNEILGELAGKWNDLSAEQRQNLGVQLAGRYQLSR